MIASCSSNKALSGIYVTNFPSYGRFSKTLTLNCDSTAVMKFQGDMMNDNSFGTWSINNKELILEFDSIQYPGSRYKGDFVLLLDGRKLLIPIISREQFERLVDTVKASNLDGKIKIKTYERFVRKFSKAPKNFRGKMRKQYFKRTEDLDCETEEK